MQVNRLLDVQDKQPLQALRGFLKDWWEHCQLDAMLAPVEQPDRSSVVIQIIEDPAELEKVNPFAPLMFINAGGRANQLRQERPQSRLGAILRPCELRTYTELRKREVPKRSAPLETMGGENMAIVGVDCLGTYPTSGPRRRDAIEIDGITREVLHDAYSGGFHTDEYRSACQVCDWPAPWGADVAIGIIGVDTDKHLLVLARDERCAAKMGLDTEELRQATEYLVSRRESTVGAIADTRAGMRKHLMATAPGHYRFDDLASLLAWLVSCSLCGNCLKACPLYQGEVDTLAGLNRSPQAERSSLADLIQTSRWLASCSGCGMCEEQCNRDVPLTLFLSALSHHIREEIQYTPGSPSQRVPWAGG